MINNSEKENTPFDYTENKIWVYFEVADKNSFKNYISTLQFVTPASLIEESYGYKILICNQHIPEIVRDLAAKNVAIYQVTRLL
ncbi:hypothetical protein [Pontimicrobium sp. MEBiC06410]